MALTRPSATQINSAVELIADPLSVLNSKSTAANLDIGFIFNRDGGTSSNVAVVWQESTQSLILALTANSGATNTNVAVTSYANVSLGNLTVYGNITGNLSTTGNVTATYFLGSGALLTGLPAGYANTNAAAYFASNTITSNIVTQGTISTIANVSGRYFLGNGSQLTGIVSGVNLTTANTAPIGPTVGALWYDTTTDIIFEYVYDGTNYQWVDITSAPLTSVAGNNNKILYSGLVNIANVTVTQVDSIPASGNTAVNCSITSIDNVYNSYKSSQINSINDGANVYYGEYGVLTSNVLSNVATFTSNIYLGNITLWAIGISSNVSVAFQRGLLGLSTPIGYLSSGPQGNVGPTGNIASSTSNWIIITNTSPSTSTTTGALQVAGGSSVQGNAYVGGILYVTNNTQSTSLTSGAVQVAGGIAVQGNAFIGAGYLNYLGVGNTITATGNITTSSGYFLGNGSLLTGIVTNPTSLINGASNVTVTSNYVNIAISSSNVTSFSNTGLAVLTSTNTLSPTSGALIVTGGVGVGGDMRIGGNLYVSNLISTTYQTLTVTDSLLYLSGNITYPYNYDIGFYGHFIGGPANVYAHTGLVRDYNTSSWYLFSNVPEPSGGTVQVTGGNVIYDPLTTGSQTVVGNANVTGNLTAGGTVSSPIIQATNGVFINSQNITANVTIPAGTSSFSVGPINIASGVNITVGNGSRHLIL
jgi:hypothetical protein